MARFAVGRKVFDQKKSGVITSATSRRPSLAGRLLYSYVSRYLFHPHILHKAILSKSRQASTRWNKLFKIEKFIYVHSTLSTADGSWG